MIRRLAAFARPFAGVLAASTALRVVQLGLGIGVLAAAVHAVGQAGRGPDAPGVAGTVGLILLLAAFGWMVTARMVRAATRSLRHHEYIRAARYLGASPTTIIIRHLLPNLSGLLVADVTVNVSAAILAETGLSYVGLGVQPPDVSLGTLIAHGTRYATTHPWMFGFCTGLLVLLVTAVHLLGEGLRDALTRGIPVHRA